MINTGTNMYAKYFSNTPYSSTIINRIGDIIIRIRVNVFLFIVIWFINLLSMSGSGLEHNS